MTKASFDIDAEELYRLQVAFKAAGKDAMKAARTVTNEVGNAMKRDIVGAGTVGQTALAAHVARKAVKYERRQVFKGKDGTVRASKFTGGYVPVIAIGVGGELPVSRKGTEKNPRPTGEQVWAGTEFGAAKRLPNGAPRFKRRNKDGYWFFPTWQAIKEHYGTVWQTKIREVMNTWERGQ